MSSKQVGAARVAALVLAAASYSGKHQVKRALAEELGLTTDQFTATLRSAVSKGLVTLEDDGFALALTPEGEDLAQAEDLRRETDSAGEGEGEGEKESAHGRPARSAPQAPAPDPAPPPAAHWEHDARADVAEATPTPAPRVLEVWIPGPLAAEISSFRDQSILGPDEDHDLAITCRILIRAGLAYYADDEE